uniref:Uncharacterized protein n=1 Tax=Cannabis sativa TaxID=3483 RepID=A0A803NYW1_CANSA
MRRLNSGAISRGKSSGVLEVSKSRFVGGVGARSSIPKLSWINRRGRDGPKSSDGKEHNVDIDDSKED